MDWVYPAPALRDGRESRARLISGVAAWRWKGLSRSADADGLDSPPATLPAAPSLTLIAPPYRAPSPTLSATLFVVPPPHIPSRRF